MNYIKKTAGIIILTFMFLPHADAQETLDVANMECIYRLTLMKDTLTGEKTEKDPAMILLAGSKYTKFYSYTTFLGDSARSSVSLQDLNANNGALFTEFIGKYPQGERYEVYKNRIDNAVIFKDRVPETVMYREVAPIFTWKISSETKTIAGYKCQKATCSFRGRDYIAWFTKDISINAGPWKFNGLPGLIVKVHDTQEHYDFELYSVKKVNKAIILEQKDYQEISLKEYIKMCKTRLVNPMTRFAGGHVTLTRADGTPFTPEARLYDVMERGIR